MLSARKEAEFFADRGQPFKPVGNGGADPGLILRSDNVLPHTIAADHQPLETGLFRHQPGGRNNALHTRQDVNQGNMALSGVHLRTKKERSVVTYFSP